MVTCKICGKKMRWIQNTHMKTHGMTTDEYRAMFPDAKLKSDDMTRTLSETRGNKIERAICKLEGCTNKVSRPNNKFCSSSCFTQNRIREGTHPLIKFGEDNPAYTDGKSSKWKAVSRSTFTRDNERCRRCEKDLTSGKKYGIHHIIPRRLHPIKEKVDDPSNLITLCNRCHRKVEADSMFLVYKLYLDGNIMEIDELRNHLLNNVILND